MRPIPNKLLALFHPFYCMRLCNIANSLWNQDWMNKITSWSFYLEACERALIRWLSTPRKTQFHFGFLLSSVVNIQVCAEAFSKVWEFLFSNNANSCCRFSCKYVTFFGSLLMILISFYLDVCHLYVHPMIVLLKEYICHICHLSNWPMICNSLTPKRLI